MKNFEQYKDVFMRCKGRNLECVASKEILKRKCDNNCAVCVEFIKKWLYEEYKEPIKITQFEYDLLINCKETTDYSENDIIENYWIIEGMKQKGYFKNIELSMNFKEVLENCEVIKMDRELLEKALDKACAELEKWDIKNFDNIQVTKEEWKEWCMKDE